jgi:mycofactocin precursor
MTEEPRQHGAAADSSTEPAPDVATEQESDDVLVEDLLVEEVSIDGMCGVY